MPSNAMKISQLVAHLQALQTQHGDLDCTLGLAADSTLAAIDMRLIGVAIELPWQRLAHPVVVFGMWTDNAGRLTNKAGAAYVAEHAAGTDWNYSRDAAPFHADGQEPVMLEVWRRDLKHARDRGYRDAAGCWYVFEGGRRPLEIVPAGVLAWRVGSA